MPASKHAEYLQNAMMRGITVPSAPGLQRCRIDAALSQRDLAARAGVSPVTVFRLENGQEARLSTIRKLAEALGVAPRELMQPPVIEQGAVP
jgi:transcriptional regulator with XRE-family HTH domain